MTTTVEEKKDGFWVELGRAFKKAPGIIVGPLVFFIVLAVTLPFIFPVLKSWISEVMLIAAFSIAIIVFAFSISSAISETIEIRKEDAQSLRLQNITSQISEENKMIKEETRKVVESMES